MLQFENLVIDRFVNYVFIKENLDRQLTTAGRDRQKFLSEGETNKAALEKRLSEIDQELRNGNDIVLEYGREVPEP